MKIGEIGGTIRRVGTRNPDCFASAAPATAYPPLATRSATFPLPSPHFAPFSRSKANTNNAPPSSIQLDPRAKDERPTTPTIPNHGTPKLFIPSKIPRATYPASKIAREASYPSEAHDETARRSEDLLWADIENVQVSMGVGTEFGKQSQNRLLISIFEILLTLP